MIFNCVLCFDTVRIRCCNGHLHLYILTCWLNVHFNNYEALCWQIFVWCSSHNTRFALSASRLLLLAVIITIIAGKMKTSEILWPSADLSFDAKLGIWG